VVNYPTVRSYHIGVVPSIEEEGVDGLGDVGVDQAAGVEPSEVGLVVAEAEKLNGGVAGRCLPGVSVADKGRDGGRSRGDGVGAEGQFLNVDAGIAVREWHAEASL
jgi:hypothetical protein